VFVLFPTFKFESEGSRATIYASATRPTIPARRAIAGLPLLLAAPVNVASGGEVLAAATLLYQTLLLVETGAGGGAGTV